jgi:hypothetical protein
MIRCLAYFEQAGKIMKIIGSIAVFLVCIAAFSINIQAQKTAKKTTPKRPTSTSTTTKGSTIPPLEVRAARVKVSNQLSNVNQFINVLGPIAQNIEDIDNQARTTKIAQKSRDDNEARKKKVIDAIRGLRDGLTNLETEFRTKPDLKRYLVSIQGISDLAAQSQNSAFAGKFVASQEPLRSISTKLSNTLAAMPDVEL